MKILIMMLVLVTGCTTHDSTTGSAGPVVDGGSVATDGLVATNDGAVITVDAAPADYNECCQYIGNQDLVDSCARQMFPSNAGPGYCAGFVCMANGNTYDESVCN